MSKGYYHTEESADEYIRLSEGFSGAALIDKLNQYLPEGSSLLELGSGPGKDFELLSKKHKVTGSDYSLEFVKRLRTKHAHAQFFELNASSLKIDQVFDCIYSNKVMHHLTDEELKQSVLRQGEILKPEGIICHSFWKGEGDEVFKGLFVNYHNKSGLLKLFEDAFDILRLEEYKEFEDNDSLLLIGKKK